MGKSKEVPIQGETPLFDERMKRAQIAAGSKTWKTFKKIFEEDNKNLLENIDLFGNTPIHVAPRSNDPKLLRELLEMVPEEARWGALRKRNHESNTVLHEVVFCKNVEVAEVIFEFEEKVQPPQPEEENEKPEEKEERKRPLLELTNLKDETPLFRAAKYGNLKMIDKMTKHIVAGHDLRRHLFNEYHTILHASLIGQFFDVAIWIITRMDDSLALEKDQNGSTCLQLLSRMPEVFSSQDPLGGFKSLIYYLLPDELGYEIDDDDRIESYYKHKRDIESGQWGNAKLPTSAISRINYALWKHLAKVFYGIQNIWEKKKQHKLVERLAELLVKKDFSWQNSYNEGKKILKASPYVPFNVAKRKKMMKAKEEKQMQDDLERRMAMQTDNQNDYNYTPLLVAASRGIVEIVDKILQENPEAINHVSSDELNIMHMVVKHRQLEIFRFIKQKAGFASLASRVSKEDRTILHQVAIMDYYRGSHQSGAAFQLQEELRWYKRVEKILPNRLYMHCDQDNLTAGDVLDIEHDDMLRDAQKWIKQTAESCSTVAVLVATVVFAAAYTIPGGSEGGTPIYLRSPVFLFFTIMDIVALAFSLASVVMFLSILTAPFELWDFHKSLPRKLNIGFAFLFLSLTTTMLAFSATILLTIRLQWKNWTSTLVYSAAFFPVTIFGLIEFPLYMMIPVLLKRGFQKLMKVLPIAGVRYFKRKD